MMALVGVRAKRPDILLYFHNLLQVTQRGVQPSSSTAFTLAPSWHSACTTWSCVGDLISTKSQQTSCNRPREYAKNPEESLFASFHFPLLVIWEGIAVSLTIGMLDVPVTNALKQFLDKNIRHNKNAKKIHCLPSSVRACPSCNQST